MQQPTIAGQQGEENHTQSDYTFSSEQQTTMYPTQLDHGQQASSNPSQPWDEELIGQEEENDNETPQKYSPN